MCPGSVLQIPAGQPAVSDFQSELANRLGVGPRDTGHTPPEEEDRTSRKTRKKKKKREGKNGKSRSRTSSKLSHSSRRSGGTGECVEWCKL